MMKDIVIFFSRDVWVFFPGVFFSCCVIEIYLSLPVAKVAKNKARSFLLFQFLRYLLVCVLGVFFLSNFRNFRLESSRPVLQALSSCRDRENKMKGISKKRWRLEKNGYGK